MSGFFNFVEVKRTDEIGLKRSNPSYLNRDGDTLVESTQKCGLPAAARQAGNSKAASVDLRQACQIVKAPPHGEVKESTRWLPPDRGAPHNRGRFPVAPIHQIPPRTSSAQRSRAWQN